MIYLSLGEGKINMDQLLLFIESKANEIATVMVCIDSIIIIRCLIRLNSSEGRYSFKQLLEKGLTYLIMSILKVPIVILCCQGIAKYERFPAKIAMLITLVGSIMTPPICDEQVSEITTKFKNREPKEDINISNFIDDDPFVIFRLIPFILLCLFLAFLFYL